MVVVGRLGTDTVAFPKVLARAAFIDHAVAVVVFPVTDLWGGLGLIDACFPLAGSPALLVAFGAFSYVGTASLGGFGGASAVVVDLAVAVVVFLVGADVQTFAVVAGGLANPLVVDDALATYTFAVALVVAWTAFVDDTITVVVFSVAAVCFGRAVFLGLGTFVVLDSSQIGANTVWFLQIVASAAEVNVAIAVVVFENGAIFFGGEHLTHTGSPLSLLAFLNAAAANSFADSLQRSIVADSL